MVYVLFGKIGNIFGKLVKAFHIILDIVGLLQLIAYFTGVTIVTVVIAYIKEMPWWGIVLLALAVLCVSLIAIAFVIRKSSGDKQLLKYPDILRALDNRNTKLALKVASQPIDESKLRQFEKDLAELLKLAPRALTIRHLSRRRMVFLKKKIVQEVTREKLLTMLSDVIDANDLGLRETQKRDFVFRYYNEQLENMPIPPSLAINDAIATCITYSNRFNNTLIFNKRYLKQMRDAVPIEYFLKNLRYADFAKGTVRRLIAAVKETIGQYLRDTAKQTARTA